MLRLFIMILNFISIISCKSKEKLSKGDLKWNPYKGGEVLVFQNNQGTTDTIFVNAIKKESVPDDPLSIFQKYYEVLNVVVKHSNPITVNEHNYLESSFFELSASDGHDTFVSFHLAAKGAWFYSSSSFSGKYLENMPVMTLKTKNFIYDDVIKLESQSIDYYDRDEFITALYWSKSKGYVRYDLKNGVYWELQ